VGCVRTEIEADQRVLLEEQGAGDSSSHVNIDHSKASLFSKERWTVYFDVDTQQVLNRIHEAVLKPHEDFIEKTIRSPDLYAPSHLPSNHVPTLVGGSGGQAIRFSLKRLKRPRRLAAGTGRSGS
jgi:hypothetical protein